MVLVIPRLVEGSLPIDTPRALLVGEHRLILASLAQWVWGTPVNIPIEMLSRTDAALSRIEEGHHERLLCDLRAPPIPATELAAQLAQRNETTRVILLGDEEDAPELVSALDCGAAGFFTRDASAEEFIEGVQAVVAGHCAIGGNLARRALARLSGREAASRGALHPPPPPERTLLSPPGPAHS